MELNDAVVSELAERVNGFAVDRNADRAETHVAERLNEARAKFTQDGIGLLSTEALDRLDDQARRQWDKDTRDQGLAIELDLAAAAAIVEDRIAAAKVLSPTIEPLV
jgi:hypothetical protein